MNDSLLFDRLTSRTSEFVHQLESDFVVLVHTYTPLLVNPPSRRYRRYDDCRGILLLTW